MVLRTVVNFAAAKRIPLIKFRKGGNPQAAPGVTATTNQASPNNPVAEPKFSPGAIEAWELPRRYWRKPMDVAEMEYINRGGPA